MRIFFRNLLIQFCIFLLFVTPIFSFGKRDYKKNTKSQEFAMEQKDTIIEQDAQLETLNSEKINTSDELNNLSFPDKVNTLINQNDNYMFSPLSIKMALAMVANGAEGKTKDEILTALGIEDLEKFNQWAKETIINLPDSENLRLQIANSLWVNTSRSSNNFSKDFLNITKENFYATAETVRDKNAVSTINNWVSEKTHKKIQGIISSPDFEVMLINALYFKGAWQNEFHQGATKSGSFYNADGSETTTDFMNRTGYYGYCSTEKGQIIKLPYKNVFDQFDENFNRIGRETISMKPAMYVLLPHPEKQPQVYKEITQAISSENIKSTYVKFSMPKFKIEFATTLNKILQSLGINSVFTRQAELAFMFQNKEQFPNFSQVLHKTYISVDEKGTEAAAVTAIAMATTSLPPKPIVLVLDRPFYFAIIDETSEEVLFMGQYSFANQKNN